MAQKHIVEVVIDHEQLLGQLLIADAWDELQDPLLHGTAGAVELLQGEVRQLRPHAGQGCPSWMMRWSGLSYKRDLHGTTEEFWGFHKNCFQDHCSGARVLNCDLGCHSVARLLSSSWPQGPHSFCSSQEG